MFTANPAYKFDTRMQAGNAGHILGSAFKPLRHVGRLLFQERFCPCSAFHKRRELFAMRSNEHSGPHGAVKSLMARNTEIVDPAVHHVNRKQASRLSTVYSRRDAILARKCSNAFHWQADAPNI